YWFKATFILLTLALIYLGTAKLEDAFRNVIGIKALTEKNYINLDINSLLISAVFSIITFCLLSPLILGMAEWYWNLTSGTKPEIGHVFGWYGSGRLFGKSLLLRINVGVRQAFWGILCFALPGALTIAAQYFIKDINLNAKSFTAAEIQNISYGGLLMMAGLFFFAGGMFLYIFATSKYILANYLVVEDTTVKTTKAVQNSIRISKGYRWELTKFVLSYAGWALGFFAAVFFSTVSGLVIGSVMMLLTAAMVLYVIPYYYSALTLFVKHIIFASRQLEEQPKTETDL
ncbi:MAG TPA: DUF975 family protein, partial [Ruminiclostridium sp.]|nr:DUF975 family protein [Ruminiclostridium sp.]